MSIFSAFKRAELMGLKALNRQDATSMVNRYLREIAAKDERRLTWIVERASQAHADKMEEIERDLVVLQHFGRVDKADELRAQLRMLEADFVFLHAVEQILRVMAADNFAREVAAYFRGETKTSEPR
jgi:hypothetical protein